MDKEFVCLTFEGRPEYCRIGRLLAKHDVNCMDMVWHVFTEVKESLGGMMHGYSYTSASLCGEDLWNKYPTAGLHRAMGICLSVMVKAGLLPLVCVNPERSNKRYRLADSFILV